MNSNEGGMSTTAHKTESEDFPHDVLAVNALLVALQTMKERCQILQQRLTTVEEESAEYRTKLPTEDIEIFGRTHDNKVDVGLLKDMVIELTRQKKQLTAHIAMVSTENRQLWSRLSKLTKETDVSGPTKMPAKDNLEGNSHQNLIRSKTFTQSNPNPMLRPRISNANDDLSLEDISLKVLNEFLEGKSEVERQCTEILNPTLPDGSLEFGYLNEDILDSGLLQDVKKCNEDMKLIRREILQQQNGLKEVIKIYGERQDICNSCKLRSQRGSNSIDKVTETDGLFDEPLNAAGTNYSATTSSTITKPGWSADILDQKQRANGVDKMCPMCGNIYSNNTTFDAFQEHVESHFIDDSELEVSIDKNFEFLSQHIGNV